MFFNSCAKILAFPSSIETEIVGSEQKATKHVLHQRLPTPRFPTPENTCRWKLDEKDQATIVFQSYEIIEHPCGPKWLYYSCDWIYWIYCTVWDRYMQVLYFGRTPRTKKTLPNFREKCWVTRHSRVFRELTGSQRTPGFGASQLAIRA